MRPVVSKRDLVSRFDVPSHVLARPEHEVQDGFRPPERGVRRTGRVDELRPHTDHELELTRQPPRLFRQYVDGHFDAPTRGKRRHADLELQPVLDRRHFEGDSAPLVYRLSGLPVSSQSELPHDRVILRVGRTSLRLASVLGGRPWRKSHKHAEYRECPDSQNRSGSHDRRKPTLEGDRAKPVYQPGQPPQPFDARSRLTAVVITRRAFLANAAVLPFAFRGGPDPLAQFRRRFKGSIVVPGDGDYDRARATASLNPRTDKRPTLIARCVDMDDVARALEFAQEQALEIAVRGGGHDVLGSSVCEGGIVLDLAPMTAIHIDPARRLARVEAGARSRDLNRAADVHGLVAALGCHPDVGIAGLTLGGGLGWFLGRFGAACDNLRAATVITADGTRRLVRADENADLFWGVRGGGGNFGIVTELAFELHAVGPVSRPGPLSDVGDVGKLLGGFIAFRSDIGSFLRFYRDFMKAAPDPLVVETSIVIVDRPVILCTVCWSGDPAEGQHVLAPLRAFGPPVADAITTVASAHLTDRPGAEFWGRAFGPPSTTAAAPRPGPVFDYWKGGSLDELTDQSIAEIVTILATASRGMSIGLGHYIHGQIARVSVTGTAIPRRAGQLTYFVDANWRDAARAEAAMGWVEQSWQVMQAHSSRRTYINYLSRDDEEAVRAAYQSNWQRLVALKRRYDPSNIFHLNRNVRP